MKNKIFKGLVPVVILAAGIVGASGVGAMAPEAARSEGEDSISVVAVSRLKSEKVPAQIDSNGVVASAQEVVIIPQVSGQVIEISDRLMPGGIFKKGDVLARIDPRDFRLNVRQQKSQVASAEVELQIEKSRVGVAEREWKLLKSGSGTGDSSLAKRVPQLHAAELRVDAAQAMLETSRLNLERSVLKAPFNAIVLTDSIDVGQVVGPNTQAIRLVGTDRFWITVSIPVEQLNLVQIPGVNSEIGSKVKIMQNLGDGSQITRDGTVLRLSGQLDAQTRRAQLVVSVDNPLEVEAGKLPLMPGAYVDVSIAGRDLDNVFVVPRSAVRNGREVWVVDGSDELASRQVAVQWGTEVDVFVSGDLAEGERLVVSPLSLPIAGQKVAPQNAKTATEL